MGVIADNAGGSAWSFGGSILSFTFPMILFILVAGALYVLYTKPEFVPGHRPDDWERPVSYTAVAGRPAAGAQAQAVPAAQATETTGTTETTESTGTTQTITGEAAGTEDPE